MEFVEGETLRAAIARGPVGLEALIGIGTRVAEVLDAAHRAGIVHGDIKPANILLSHSGQIKLADFGIARRMPLENGLRESGSSDGPMMAGTLSYMSPEQRRGLPLDGRSDIFSLAVVLYEAACGRRPFDDGAVEGGTRPLTPLRGTRADLPEGLEKILQRALAEDAVNRFQTAASLTDALRELQNPAREAPGSQLPARVNRRRARLALAGCAIALAAALIYYFLPGVRAPTSNWYQKTRITRIAVDGEENCLVISPSGRYLACGSLLPDSSRALSVRLFTATRSTGVVPPSLSAYYAVAFSPDEQYLYYTVHRIGGGDPGALFRVPVQGGARQELLENIGSFTFSPEGTKIAFLRIAPAGAVTVANLDGSNPRELFRKPGINGVGWSSDGNAILYLDTIRQPAGRSYRMMVREANGTTRPVAGLGSLAPISFSPLPDGSGFLMMAADPETHQPQIWYQPRSGPARQVTHDLNEYYGLSVTRDGKRIVTGQASRESELWRVDTKNPEATQLIVDFHRHLTDPVWLRGEEIVATSGVTGAVLRVISPDGSGEHSLLRDGSIRGAQASACPDRPDVVFASLRNGNANVWRVLPESHEARQLTFAGNVFAPQCIAGGTVVYRAETAGTHITMQVPLDGGTSTPSNSLAWNQQVSPNGEFTATNLTDDKTHEDSIVIRTRDGSRTVLTVPTLNDVMAWAPDSRGIAYLDRADGGTEIWYRPLDGHAPRKLTHLRKGIFSFAWSPDGRYLVCAAGRISTAPMSIEDVR